MLGYGKREKKGKRGKTEGITFTNKERGKTEGITFKNKEIRKKGERTQLGEGKTNRKKNQNKKITE